MQYVSSLWRHKNLDNCGDFLGKLKSGRPLNPIIFMNPVWCYHVIQFAWGSSKHFLVQLTPTLSLQFNFACSSMVCSIMNAVHRHADKRCKSWGFARLCASPQVWSHTQLTALWRRRTSPGRHRAAGLRPFACWCQRLQRLRAMKMKAFMTSQTGSTPTVFDSATTGSSRSDRGPAAGSRWRMRWRNAACSAVCRTPFRSSWVTLWCSNEMVSFFWSCRHGTI